MIIGLNGYHSLQLHAVGIEGLLPCLIAQRSLRLNSSGPWYVVIHHASQSGFGQVEDTAVCIRYLGLCIHQRHSRRGVYHGAGDGESGLIIVAQERDREAICTTGCEVKPNPFRMGYLGMKVLLRFLSLQTLHPQRIQPVGVVSLRTTLLAGTNLENATA